MGPVAHVTRELSDGRRRRALEGPRPAGRSGALRVVMVVANDVTRDSRVLREAAVLAGAGHQVTVLGIMTARTEAPPVELRDGFVIRRLSYRARPPGWWVPPDFYQRVRYRADRQSRIHRARAVAVLRRGARAVRLTRARLTRARLARASIWRRPVASLRAARPYRAVTRRMALGLRFGSHDVPGLGFGPGAPRRPGSSLRVRPPSFVVVLRRALRTPLPAWPDRLARRQRGAARSTRQLVRRRTRTLSRSTARAMRVGLHSAASGSRTVLTGAGTSVWRVLQPWFAIALLVTWGSVYLLTNRASRGAIEWMTGWRWRWLGWAEFVLEHAPDADVWHAHDMTSLPAVSLLKRRRGGFAVYDSHEVYLESGRHAQQPRWAKAPLERLERRLVGDMDAVITVNLSLAEILGTRLNRDDVLVLYNCPMRPERTPRGSRLRRRLGLPRTTPLLLYHGSLAPHRGVEQLLEAMQRPELSSAHLAFLGFGPLYEWLTEEASRPGYRRRVHVLPAVPPDELLEWIAGVDVAVAPIQASTLNHTYSSPNKVFEAIATGTPVAGSDFPEFRRVIRDPQYGPLGELFDPAQPAQIAAAVRRLLDLPHAERARLRRRCRAASRHRWNWEAEGAALVGLYGGFASDATRAVGAA